MRPLLSIPRGTRRRGSIPLFAETPSHPSVPLDDPSAAARSRGQGRPQAGAGALPLAGASTAAGSRSGRNGAACLGLVLVAGLAFAGIGGAPSFARAAPPVGTQSPPPYADFIAEAAERFDIPATWIRAVIDAESDKDARAISPNGAIGLMQIMPRAWDRIRVHYDLGSDPLDPRDNILAGTAHLRELHDQYGSAGFLVAYSAGRDRYEAHRDHGTPLPPETAAYVARLSPIIREGLVDKTPPSADPAARRGADAALFVPRSEHRAETVGSASGAQAERTASLAPAADLTALTPQSAGLFVARSRSGEAP